MRLYEVQATECNGKQEYAHSKLLAAENIGQAWLMARDYFRQWYDDGDESETHSTNNPNRFTFIGDGISLEIDGIAETTLERWKQQQMDLHSIGILPETESVQEKLESLLEVCEYIRDCLNVGGEQSRQFAAEIKILRDVIGHPCPAKDTSGESQRCG